MATKEKKSWLEKLGPNERDALSFLLGIVGIIHEITNGKVTERPFLLTLLGGLLGLPLVLRKGEKDGAEK